MEKLEQFSVLITEVKYYRKRSISWRGEDLDIFIDGAVDNRIKNVIFRWKIIIKGFSFKLCFKNDLFDGYFRKEMLLHESNHCISYLFFWSYWRRVAGGFHVFSFQKLHRYLNVCIFSVIYLHGFREIVSYIQKLHKCVINERG